MAPMSVMDERPPDAAQHVAPLSSVNGPSRAPPMSPMRWQIEPPPLAAGAGAQWLIAALVALGPFSLTMYQPALPSIASSLNITTAQVQLTLTGSRYLRGWRGRMRSGDFRCSPDRSACSAGAGSVRWSGARSGDDP